jgi:hypothetical protein
VNITLHLTCLESLIISNCVSLKSYFNPLATELNPICNYGNLGSWQSVYTQLWHRKTFCVYSMLKHCAANRKRRLSALPSLSPYKYDVKISGFTRSSIYTIYNISRLMVNHVRLALRTEPLGRIYQTFLCILQPLSSINGKTPICSTIGLYSMFLDGREPENDLIWSTWRQLHQVSRSVMTYLTTHTVQTLATQHMITEYCDQYHWISIKCSSMPGVSSINPSNHYVLVMTSVRTHIISCLCTKVMSLTKDNIYAVFFQTATTVHY